VTRGIVTMSAAGSGASPQGPPGRVGLQSVWAIVREVTVFQSTCWEDGRGEHRRGYPQRPCRRPRPLAGPAQTGSRRCGEHGVREPAERHAHPERAVEPGRAALEGGQGEVTDVLRHGEAETHERSTHDPVDQSGQGAGRE